MATQPREHSMPSQMVNFMFTVSFAKRGGSASNEKLNLAEILQSDTARYIHRALKTIFHSDFSCSNINSCSWERRARIMNDCSSCLTPTGLPQLSCVPLHSQLKDFAIFLVITSLRVWELEHKTRSVCLLKRLCSLRLKINLNSSRVETTVSLTHCLFSV